MNTGTKIILSIIITCKEELIYTQILCASVQDGTQHCCTVAAPIHKQLTFKLSYKVDVALCDSAAPPPSWMETLSPPPEAH